jgi:sugar phosphate isomerase/epimerase
VIQDSRCSNCGILVDALHLARSGGDSVDLHALPSQAICSAQLCDAPAGRPATTESIIQEARAGRMLPGDGDSTLHRLLAEPPDRTALSVEVPNGGHPS